MAEKDKSEPDVDEKLIKWNDVFQERAHNSIKPPKKIAMEGGLFANILIKVSL